MGRAAKTATVRSAVRETRGCCLLSAGDGSAVGATQTKNARCHRGANVRQYRTEIPTTIKFTNAAGALMTLPHMTLKLCRRLDPASVIVALQYRDAIIFTLIFFVLAHNTLVLFETIFRRNAEATRQKRTE